MQPIASSNAPISKAEGAAACIPVQGAAALSPLQKLLSEASVERLRETLFQQLIKENLLGALHVSEELARRGVAPVFQLRHPFGLLEALAHGKTRLSAGQVIKLEKTGCVSSHESISLPVTVEFILLCIDLKWIAVQYPVHKPEWLRASGVFKKADFLRTAKYLFWGGRREAGQISKALALKPQQQRECCFINCLVESRWRGKLVMRFYKAAELIDSSAGRSKDRRSEDEQRKTLKRRRDIWLCAEMANWKPQRTADLYQMLTGEVLQRNNIANQIAKLPNVRRSD